MSTLQKLAVDKVVEHLVEKIKAGDAEAIARLRALVEADLAKTIVTRPGDWTIPYRIRPTGETYTTSPADPPVVPWNNPTRCNGSSV